MAALASSCWPRSITLRGDDERAAVRLRLMCDRVRRAEMATYAVAARFALGRTIGGDEVPRS